MNESERTAAIQRYLDEIKEQFESGHATEHSYRPALKRLIASFEKVRAVNEPKHSEYGAPDFVFASHNSKNITLGYAEAKDITVNLDKTEKTDQMQRYHGYANLFLTDYLEFRFFRNGEKYETISLGEVKTDVLHLKPENGERLMRELEAFLSQTPERIRSGKRLAQIMGGKARRIRDNVKAYLDESGERNVELEKMYTMMRRMLVHDLELEKFADMYAQTLVYGLFVARYSDTTPDNFDRSEARDLVPKSNPFLRHFFDHIVGPNFDARLGYIVDELCEVFSVSDVQEIVHKHLRIQDETSDTKDPIIHFYEDFLQEYDATERKKMGAYYTPIPVVKYIVRQVDRILKENFGLSKGLSSTESVRYEVETGQDLRHDKRQKLNTRQTLTIPRVQVLDPAVGTATFLNETIKFIYQSFRGQEGRWPSYVNENLLKRLHGFELMMAPYTIAHLKLGMTLKETGVEKLNDRLGVYLTNTLEEGTPNQTDIFSFGLAEAVSEESRLASEIKSERPVMVVMGNPPYSVSSNNKSKFIEKLVADYKKDLNERNIQPLSDDYIKFIRFAEAMITKNGSGIVAMITNNSYIDGLIHRQMRKHLLQTFDKIYVLDLHGNSKKKETASGGSKDENVFDIQQGVSIVLAVKTSSEQVEMAEVFHADLLGTRKFKFAALNEDKIEFKRIDITSPSYVFIQKDFVTEQEYKSFVSINDLMPTNDVGVSSYRDGFVTDIDRDILKKRIKDFYELPSEVLKEKYKLKFSQGESLRQRQENNHFDDNKICITDYRPFDKRYMYLSSELVDRPRWKNTKHIFGHKNLSLVTIRRSRDESKSWNEIFVSDNIPTGATTITSLDRNYVAPLYIYHEDGTRTPNFAPAELARLTVNLTSEPTPLEIFDYIYAILHSSKYRQKYKEFLKTDFPRVPIPEQKDFDRLVPLGHSLRELHLMKLNDINKYDTVFPEVGSNIVEKVEFKRYLTESVDGKVYNVEGVVRINEKQYFGNVPEKAWDFYIGGYQPAQKWLKDRKGSVLNDEDLDHYQKIIKILVETDQIMEKIDENGVS